MKQFCHRETDMALQGWQEAAQGSLSRGNLTTVVTLPLAEGCHLTWHGLQVALLPLGRHTVRGRRREVVQALGQGCLDGCWWRGGGGGGGGSSSSSQRGLEVAGGVGLHTNTSSPFTVLARGGGETSKAD